MLKEKLAKNQLELLIIGLLLLLSLPAVWPLLGAGFYEPHDVNNLANIYQLIRAITSGQIPPRLGPDFTFSFGYPLFNFYHVLPFYLGAAWYFVWGSLIASFKFVFLLGAVFSVWGMYLFLRQFLGRWPSLVGSLLYLYTPYRAVEIYVRGAMGEALALAILPFVAWAIVRVVRRPSRLTVAMGGLILGLFIISHNLLPLLVAPFLVSLALLVTYLEKQRRQKLKGLLATGLVGLGLSFYWWFPAAVESGLVAQLTPFKVEDHFPFLRQLIFPSWGYGASVPGIGDEMSFQIGIVNLLVVAAGLVIFLFFRRVVKDKTTFAVGTWAILGFLLALFLLNIRSLPLWQLVPFYQFVQFPWRLLFLTTFFSAVLLAAVIQVLPKKWGKVAGVAVVVASLALTVGYFQPSKIVYQNDAHYLQRFFEDPTYSEDYLLLPKWVEKRPTSKPTSKIEVEEGEVVDINQRNLVSWSAEIVAPKPSKVTFNAYYFPGWFARVDGSKVEVKPGEPYGQIELDVPQGSYTVEFFWQETPLRQVADLVSLGSGLLLLALLTVPIWRRR